jgi:hypothetical protein
MMLTRAGQSIYDKPKDTKHEYKLALPRNPCISTEYSTRTLSLQAVLLRYISFASSHGGASCELDTPRTTPPPPHLPGIDNPFHTRKLIVLFVLGYRMKAINIIGREVMLQRGLIGLGLDTLDQSGPEIREALSLYANPQSLPILVHCTQGKDRTGRAGS